MFRMSVYEPIRQRVKTAAGSGVKDSFKMQIDSDGRRSLVRDGKIDIYMQIQSHKDSVDINFIMTRFANGDSSALSKAQGLYGDFTNIPTSINDLQNRVLDAEKLFYQLPVEVREKFEHNPSMFYHMIGSDSFNEILGVDKTTENPVVEAPTVVPNNPLEVSNE